MLTPKYKLNTTFKQTNEESKKQDPPKMPEGVCQVGKEYYYASTDVIGEGFSSTVYRGTHLPTNRIVSIKVIRKDLAKQKNLLSIVINEVKIMKKLQHENVLSLEGVEENDRRLCIVTEYCNGGDLAELILKKKRLSEAQATYIIQDIIKGYGQLIKNGIIHRDLKPSNIFFYNGRAKIADFGFAMSKHDFNARSQQVGSPMYMPLQTLENLEYSHKSDIFAIGLIFYEMLHGYMPWDATKQNDLIQRIKKCPHIVDESLNLSEKSKAFLDATLQRKAEKRIDESQLLGFFRKYKANSALNLSQIKSPRIENTKNIFQPRASFKKQETLTH